MTTLADLRAITSIVAERTRQDAKWGEQNHPDGTGPNHSAIGGILAFSASRIDNLHIAAAATQRTDDHATAGGVTWEDILTEEWAEAIAEADPAEELVQVAAVTVGWLGAIERRTPRRERIYLSGPIAGIPDARERFEVAASALDPEWFEVVNPFNVAPLEHPGEPCGRGYHPGDNDAGHVSSACYMRTDLFALLSCDSIRMLAGWENSRGAQVELAVAKACGLGITYAREVDAA